MYALKVYGIPENIDRDLLVEIKNPLRIAIASTKLNVTPHDVTVFFPPDMVQEGLGEKLYAEISGLDDLCWSKSQRTTAAENVAQVLEMFVVANIPQCREICVKPTPISGSLVGCANKYIPSR